MRLFVALCPPADVCVQLRTWLDEALARRGRNARLSPVERWHLTLAFLGEVADERVPDVERAIAGGVFPRMRLRLTGSGSFGGGRSRAVWTGLDGDLEALHGLHAALQRGLAASGLPHDQRPLVPHLTVSYKGNRDMLAALKDYDGPVWTATEVLLVRSWYPEERGYETVRAWPLAQNSPRG